MPRKKLSEFRAKTVLASYTNSKYEGVEVVNGKHKKLGKKNYVAKVDQAIKKRGKQGLVGVNLNSTEADKVVNEFLSKGYEYSLIEPYIEHGQDQERYFSLRLVRNGISVTYNPKGGVEVESAKEKMINFTVPLDTDGSEIAKKTSLPHKFVANLLVCMEENFFSFVELNPLLVDGDKVTALDMAVEVDDAGAFFVESWNKSDFRYPKTSKKSEEEVAVEELNNNSQASFRLEVLNPDGGIFMLLSGGGASVTLADEVHNQGHGGNLANYGEYSGAPNAEETRYYTKQVISLLLKSKAKKKSLIIAGGVANFTDVLVTFTGVIQALRDKQNELNKQGVKVYVRRGGPNETKGLKAIEDFLIESKLLGAVHGSDVALTDIVNIASEGVK